MKAQVNDTSKESVHESLIFLSDIDALEGESSVGGSDFLQASRDAFLNRVAFDFSPVFFRIRGYDSRYSRVYVNGISMNRFYDGRPQWNNWGGLNDITRQQRFFSGLAMPEVGFGALQGTTQIDIGPSEIRDGIRVTFSGSNRFYQGRMMATYNTGIGRRGWGILVSGSRRLGRDTYMDGTPYDALSFMTGLGFKPDKRHEFTIIGVTASSIKGRSAALTPEVMELTGRTYNPNWGYQGGKVRNARLRSIREPFLNFRYRYRSPKLSFSIAAAYQWGTQNKTRLGYFNAPNPEPTYYRNLPSFYWNQSFGPNLLSAEAVRSKLRETPQIDWKGLYRMNNMRDASKSAAYILLSDRLEETRKSLNGNIFVHLGKHWKLRSGLEFHNSRMDHFAHLDDLLGASYHEDVDPFSNTRNDLVGSLNKLVGDRIGYNYRLLASALESFISVEAEFVKWKAFISGRYGDRSYRRIGLFQNERYRGDAALNHLRINSPSLSFKGGATYQFNGRHRLQVNGALLKQPHDVQKTYINPREHGMTLPALLSEKIVSTDLSYFFRSASISARITTYYTRIMDSSDVNHFYVNSGFGAGFVHQVITGTDILHKGFELSLQTALGPSVEMTGVLALGNHRYASNPSVSLYFLPGKDPGDLRNENGYLSLGMAELKGYNIASGPSSAASLGLRYQGPAYWWTGVTLNYLERNYPDITVIRHTRSFELDPDTGEVQSGVSESDLQRARKQKPLPPAYLLNLTAGKSWRWNRNYLGLFVSLSNVLDQFFLSGGYQQSRNGHYKQWAEDHRSGKPSFTTKFWPGWGRTYFMNLSWSF